MKKIKSNFDTVFSLLATAFRNTTVLLLQYHFKKKEMDYKEIAKETIGFLYQSHLSIRQSGIDNKLVALAELRTSQLNGCAYCCSFHSEELRKMGVEQKLIDLIPGYKHSASFDTKQDLVLRWTDAITLISENIDDIKQEMEEYFSQRELVELTASISLMNALNRLRVTLGDKF